MAEKTEKSEALVVESKSEMDPIADKSMSGILLISSLILMLSLLWALYDELYGTRPWKNVQRRYVENYAKYLKKKIKPSQGAVEKEVKSSPEYQQFESDIKAADEASKPIVKEITAKVKAVEQELLAITAGMQETRSLLAALTYELEQVSDKKKDSYRREIEDERKKPHDVSIPGPDGKAQSKKMSYNEMEARFAALKDEKAKLSADLVDAQKAANELRKKRDEFVQNRMPGLNEDQIAGLIKKLETFDYSIKQIHVAEADMVDRCTSCHLNILEPITITREDAVKFLFPKKSPKNFSAKAKEDITALVTHPNRDLLQIHDPDRFACSTCHGGNGRATSSTIKGHGRNKYWLWPLYQTENAEAGCQQCHSKDRDLSLAASLNRGKELYQLKGCVGCHRYEGYDRESEGLFNTRQTIKNLEMERTNNLREIDRVTKAADTAATNEEAQRLYARADNLRVTNSQFDAKIDQLQIQARYLMQDQKKIGPNLKEIKLKLKKEWVPFWLEKTHEFRPDTKMPQFRLTKEDIQAISAFLWQKALDGSIPEHQPGDSQKGRQSIESRGCLACHSIEEGDKRHGGEFATNLSRLGEKANLNYVVRWISNPRERARPYCPKEKKDIGPEDYEKKGLPFKFDANNTKCPNCGAEMQVQNMTVMPNFRLSDQEVRDIATYLIQDQGLNKSGAAYSDVSFMDDPKLKDRGLALVKNYGCASCHEIAGLEDAGRIGTELTKEGSKPIERLDFGRLEHEFKHKNEYDHKTFFENKLAKPEIYDTGKEKAPQDRLKMPKPNLKEGDITALTTFLLGSSESTMPESFMYNPSDQRKDVQEGMWVIKKYNCMGCHKVAIGQSTMLQGLAQYQGDGREKLPPRLTSEGARVDPRWLLKFLSNPALNEAETDRNGVRTYLEVRMPTFSFSPNELQALVRFFAAASAQAEPYIPTRLETVSEQEKSLGRQLFSSKAAPCLKCHLTGDAGHDKTASAPNFLLASERLKPEWTARWLLDPALIDPGTAMPSGLFEKKSDRWILKGELPTTFESYSRDHVELLVRYMFQLTPEEQRKISASSPGGGGPTAFNRYNRNNQAGRNRVMMARGYAVSH